MGVKAGFRVKCGQNWVKYNRAAWIMGELERSRAKKRREKWLSGYWQVKRWWFQGLREGEVLVEGCAPVKARSRGGGQEGQESAMEPDEGEWAGGRA